MQKKLQKNTRSRRVRVVMALVMAMSLLVTVMPAFAQAPTATLNINTSDITTNLFMGANVIIGALLAVVMLMAGFKFGSMILDRLVKAINF